MNQRNIELHIEELVLHSFAPGDRYRIAETVKRELARLLTEQGVSQSLSQCGEIAHLDGGAFEAARCSKSEVIGAKVAQAIYGGLNR